MFKGKNKLRVKAICLFQQDDYIFVSRDKDSIKNDYYYRPVGGNVEFGEYTKDAIVREIKEELNTEIENLELVQVMENIFECDGIKGHEIMYLYKADFKDKSFYEKKAYKIIEPAQNGKNEEFDAGWYKISDFKNGKLRLVPEGLNKML